MAHRLFTVDDICASIVEAVPEYSEQGPRTRSDASLSQNLPHVRTLAALARVSKIFKKPALIELWRELPNLTPLARLFSPDTFLLKVINPDSMARWQLVSKMVVVAANPVISTPLLREVFESRLLAVKRISFNEHTCITPAAAHHLGLLAAPTISVVYITWSAVTPDGIRALEHFLCLSLRTLELRCSKESRADDLISVIQKLPQACPGLVTLRLSYVQHWDAVDTQERLVSALQKVLPEMTSLRFFQGTEFLITLGILPVLARSKSLCFNGDHGVMHEFDSASFPMLHEVNITGNADICTKFMAAFSPVNRIRVSKLHADLHDDRLDDSTARLFLRAIQSVLSDSLLELEIISDWPFKSECLDSLFGCHHLVALVIPILFDNGDADGSLFTARATRAWPNLVRHDFSYLHTYLAELVLLGPVLFPI